MPASGSSGRRHAQAAFEVAKERGRLDQWHDDLWALVRAAALPELAALLRNPRAPLAVKRQALRDALPGLSPEALNLATILVARGTLAALIEPIARDYDRRLDDERGIVRAEVTTAVEMDPAQRAAVSEQLAQATGRQVRLEHRLDPAILGGMVIRLGDQVVDGSVRSRLKDLRRSLVETRG